MTLPGSLEILQDIGSIGVSKLAALLSPSIASSSTFSPLHYYHHYALLVCAMHLLLQQD